MLHVAPVCRRGIWLAVTAHSAAARIRKSPYKGTPTTRRRAARIRSPRAGCESSRPIGMSRTRPCPLRPPARVASASARGHRNSARGDPAPGSSAAPAAWPPRYLRTHRATAAPAARRSPAAGVARVDADATPAWKSPRTRLRKARAPGAAAESRRAAAYSAVPDDSDRANLEVSAKPFSAGTSAGPRTGTSGGRSGEAADRRRARDGAYAEFRV